jgi:hypothetical protein
LLLPPQREVHTGPTPNAFWDAHVCASSKEKPLIITPHHWIKCRYK